MHDMRVHSEGGLESSTNLRFQGQTHVEVILRPMLNQSEGYETLLGHISKLGREAEAGNNSKIFIFQQIDKTS